MKVYTLMQVVQESADYQARYLLSIYSTSEQANKQKLVDNQLNLDAHVSYEVEEHEVIEKSK